MWIAAIRKHPALTEVIVVVALSTVLTFALISWMGFDLRLLSGAPIGGSADGDPYQECWAIYQGMDNLLHRPFALGYSTIYYNDPNSFAYTNAPYSLSILLLPLYLLTHNLELTYNIYYLASWVLAALAGYWLVKYLLNPPGWVAILVGLMIAFSAQRVTRIAQITELSAFLILFSLYFLHRLIDDPRRRWAIGLAISFFLTLFMSGYLGMMFVVSGAIILVYALYRQKLSGRFAQHFIEAVLLMAVLSAPFLAFRAVNSRFASGQSLDQIYLDSARIESWFSGSSVIYKGLVPHQGEINETLLFFGFIPLGLWFLAWRWRKSAAVDTPSSGAFSAKDVILVYSIIMAAAYLITLGPVIRFGGTELLPGPYALLMNFPGFTGMRAISRFILVPVVGTALLSAYAIMALRKRLDNNMYWLTATVIVAALVLENIPYNGSDYRATDTNRKFRELASLPMQQRRGFSVPQRRNVPVYSWLAQQPSGTAIFEYPEPSPINEGQYLIDVQLHNQPMVNAFLAALEPDWYRRVNWINFPDVAVVNVLAQRGVRYALVHRASMSARDIVAFDERLAEFAATSGPLTRVKTFEDVDVYALPLGIKQPVVGTGWYPPETQADGLMAAWTGPDTESSIEVSSLPSLPLLPSPDLWVNIHINNYAALDILGSVKLRANGVDIPLTLTSESTGVVALTGTIPSALVTQSTGPLVLRLNVNRTAALNSADFPNRVAGLLISSVWLTPFEQGQPSTTSEVF